MAWLNERTFTCHALALGSSVLRFTQCEICFKKKDELAKACSMEEKLTTLLEYRKHLSDQYADRAALWSLQEAAVDEMADLLVCQLDGMDQAKFRIPRDPRLRCTASLPFGLGLFCFQCFSTFLWLPYRCAR